MRIAVCDDQLFFVNKISCCISNHFSNQNIIHVLNKFTSANELINSLAEVNYDVIFLDVDMPKMNGIDAAMEIKRILPQCIFVFISAFIEYAPNGYHVNAVRYILKSQLDGALPECLDFLYELIYPKQCSILLNVNNEEVKFALSDILFFEGAQHYITINHVNSSISKLLARAKLGDIEYELSDKGFLRIHKSFIVNMQYISSIKNYTVTLCNSKQLKISATNFASVRKKYLLWKGENI